MHGAQAVDRAVVIADAVLSALGGSFTYKQVTI
jgi:hypothetical protein